MNIKQQFLTRNDCYRAGKTIRPKGVMVHSTGANNPRVSRYTTAWDKPGVQKCVHAFVGRLDGGTIGTVQTLPWTMRGWHCGKGKKGSANNTHISFEICEDGLTDASYFNAVYREAVELTARLCKEYGLDPLADGVVICHAEGYQRGVASNHGDVLHWFPRFGKTMDDFRANVAREMEETDLTEEQVRTIVREEYDRIERERAGQPASEWAKGPLEQAKARGITDGTRPQSYAARQEVAAMINAALK